MRPILCLVLLVASPLLLAQKGIKFQELDLKKLIKKVNKSKKLLFVDAYADWCGPCKMMDKKVFPKKEVYKFFNKNFLSVKLNTEEDKNAAFLEKFPVKAMPTFFFIGRDTQLILKHSGASSNPEYILNIAEAALDINLLQHPKKPQPIERPSSLKIYTLYLLEQKAPEAEEYFDAYMNTQPDWKNDKLNLEFILKFIEKPEGKPFSMFWDNQRIFEDSIGKAEINELRLTLLLTEVLGKTPPKEPLRNLDISKTEPLFKKYFPNDAEEQFVLFKLRHYQEILDFQNIREVVKAYIRIFALGKNPLEGEKLGDAYQFAASLLKSSTEATDDHAADYQLCLDWALKASKLVPSEDNLLLLYDLHIKLGKNTRAEEIKKSVLELRENPDRD